METKKYVPVIGVEIHLELNTKTKMFSQAINSFSKEENTNISLIDLGFLGTLPKVNEEAVKKAIFLASALNMNIESALCFDRKNYFYPDLPKGYQITQQFRPIGTNGFINIPTQENQQKQIAIQRIHLEEDTAKQIHKDEFTYLDYNRAGAPLIEIVTYPVMSSAEEAAAYVDEIRKLALFLKISDAKLEEGSLRADINLSLKEATSNEFGTKVEIKNINSISNIKKAINLEIEEQTNLLNYAQKVQQVTKRYDDKNNLNKVLREKTDSVDYRYFPETNIPCFALTNEYKNQVLLEIKPTPEQVKLKLKEALISDFYIDQILNNVDFWEYLDSVDYHNLEKTTKVFFAEIVPIINKVGFQNLNIKPSFLKQVLEKLEENKINLQHVKKILPIKNKEVNLTLDEIIHNLDIKVYTREELETLLDELINEHQEYISKNTNNNDKTEKFLMGQAMKKTKSNANPTELSEIISKKLAFN
ncbi:Asp-tRNA(Asn)/Glu-tRNA(Gln) amidotransferase subunit GatB [Mesomycoplasma hyorhinis]|uniref:Aspartyl/glutamyl-tRNA(Asn/Gln) amidotransferase subunit B n=1 Tax=Mesomycoplasma hyorhinis (strain MCLD) TaxID=936139 RepID=A0ABM5M6L0_MESHM|nr:aspartyl/glutamyl-tRNA amidotransferase subunit B [Mesomycoplasma hyorhinis MCLD]AEX14353.1 Asp-tRNAAsn/Glu-tRNAGln amidotransferase B subunit [Mesomycoplasma hyorhinis GDL-1]AHA41371.1 aspartyl/glutamyl-tRNA(Asn/Gln) amidotransferase, B subunit [Mesomycoplasma hyorhinis DBS 1050]AOD25598.1 Asp-tRNAAsn/Glu-tRNAGln amidotransferase B subunit [Mesomycoplasma hyorhinis]VEU58120.1 Aspartyl/glutamyl-tRNA(Asn/Gln) amidotransferase subunit B [Mesomycoplasma hyorhinis]